MSTTVTLARHRTLAPAPARPHGATRRSPAAAPTPSPAATPTTSPTGSRVIALHRPRVTRLLQALAAKWLDWRRAVQRRREERLLAALPDHVLRDMGLGHLVRQAPPLPWPDMDRIRW